jgi:hypothetical protein
MICKYLSAYNVLRSSSLCLPAIQATAWSRSCHLTYSSTTKNYTTAPETKVPNVKASAKTLSSYFIVFAYIAYNLA